MDIISYFIIGACIGCLMASKKIGNKAVLYGGLCALLPSIDTLIAFFFDISNALFIDGCFSHSIIFCVLLAPVLGWLLHKYVNNTECSVLCWTNIAFWSMLSHCLCDVLTVSGAEIFAPFSYRRIALSILANVDIVCIALLLCVCVIVICVKDWQRKTIVSWFGLVMFVLYIVFAGLNKLSIHSQFEQKLRVNNIRYSQIEVFPVNGSMFLWNCVAKYDDGFWMCYQSNFSRNNFELNLFFRNDYYLFEYEQNPTVQRLKDYTRDFYIVEKINDDMALFHDLRYGREGIHQTDRFISSYIVELENEKDVVVSQKEKIMSLIFIKNLVEK